MSSRSGNFLVISLTSSSPLPFSIVYKNFTSMILYMLNNILILFCCPNFPFYFFFIGSAQGLCLCHLILNFYDVLPLLFFMAATLMKNVFISLQCNYRQTSFDYFHIIIAFLLSLGYFYSISFLITSLAQDQGGGSV